MLSLIPADVRRPLLAFALAALTAGCAASAALHRGQDAERQQEYDRAVVEYTNALRKRPNDLDARLGLERAKIRSSADHFQRGRRLAGGTPYGSVKVWDSATGRELLDLKVPEATISSVAFSPDGHRLAAGTTDARIHLWDGTPRP